MTTANLDTVLRLVRKLSDGQDVRSLSDGELLERFRTHGEEAAFALLVERHGPMVLDVCRRGLGNSHDAEDAFQATFLVLVRKATSIRSRDSLPSWLHGVARRVASQARIRARRRRDVALPPPPALPTDPGANLSWDELRTLVDEEMGRLPEDQRAAVILCCLEGRSQEQAAKELGCPKSTLASRLEKGRDVLRRRLARRGFELPAGVLASVLAAAPAAASLPAVLLIAAVRAATLGAKGAADAGVVSAKVLALTAAAVRSMTPWKLTWTVLAACVCLTGSAVLAYHGLRKKPVEDPPPTETSKPPVPPPDDGGERPRGDVADVDRLLDEVRSGKTDRRLLCLEVSYAGPAADEKGLLRLYGNGVGEWGPTQGFEEPFTLTADQVTALLEQLAAVRLGTMPRQLSGGGPNPTTFLQVGLTIKNVRKDVLFYVPAGGSIFRPDLGPAATRLAGLAKEVRRLVVEAYAGGERVANPEDGLRKIANGTLPAEHLYFSFDWRRTLPPVQDDAAPDGAPGKEPAPVGLRWETWTLSVCGPLVRASRSSHRDKGMSPAWFALDLSREELIELARFLLETDAANLPAHLARPGADPVTAAPQVRFDLGVIQPRVMRVLLGPESQLAPEYAKTYDRLYERLHRLNQRVLKEGQPVLMLGAFQHKAPQRISVTRSHAMRMLLPVACLLLFAFTPDAQAGDPSIETVEKAPAKFDGQTLAFDKVKLAGKLIKHTNLWCLNVTTPDGTNYSAAAKFGAQAFGTFFVSEDIADRLRDDLKEDAEYTVKLTGKVYKKKYPGIGAEGWVTEVSQIDFYTDGKIANTINAKTPRSNKALTLERVNEAPQKYAGQTLVFDKVKLAGKMIKHTGVYCLHITSEDGGTVVSAAVHFIGGITFMVSEDIAERLLDDLKEDSEYTVKLTCKVYKKKFVSEGADAWMAEVSQLDFYTDGKIAKTIDAKSPRSGKAPTLERVNEAPQKYAGQTLVFDKVKLGGKMIKHTGVYCLHITSEDGGTVVSAAVHFGRGIAFVAPDKLADRIAREIKEGSEYTVKVTSKLSKKKFPDEAWIAEVSQVDFYKDDKIVKTLK